MSNRAQLTLHHDALLLKCRAAVAAAVLAVILLVVLVPAASAEVIRSFDADISLLPDCSLDVVEKIKMDFEQSQRHGIRRWIPVEYKRHGGAYTLALNLIDVTDEANHTYQFETQRVGEDLNVRVGSPEFTISGVHFYRLHYTVKRAVNFFGDAPEVYWNVTGPQSPFTIEKATARFHPPPDTALSELRTACFTGVQGSRETGKITIGKDAVVFSAHDLKPGEELTIVVGLPAGSVSKPSFWQEFLWYALDWCPLFAFPLGVSYLLFIVWWRTGRDEDGGKPVAVEWNPPKDLSPAEVGTLVDESCDMQDIVSTLIDLAARGYLKIEEVQPEGFILFFSKKDYRFTKSNKEDKNESLLAHEKLFLKGLFTYDDTTCLSDLRHRFYEHVEPIRNSVYSALMDKQLFKDNPVKVRNSYLGMGIVVGILGLLAFAVGQLALGGGLMISGLIAGCSARAMPARTKAGSQKQREILGFQRYVALTEKRRLAELAKDDPTIFGRLLPYAMVLGVADKWAESFKDLLTEPPDWYVPVNYGSPNYIFYPTDFVHDLGGAMNTTAATFAAGPPPSSSDSGAGGGFSGFGGGFSGGGFSGGGFGGGGTGSW